LGAQGAPESPFVPFGAFFVFFVSPLFLRQCGRVRISCGARCDGDADRVLPRFCESSPDPARTARQAGRPARRLPPRACSRPVISYIPPVSRARASCFPRALPPWSGWQFLFLLTIY